MTDFSTLLSGISHTTKAGKERKARTAEQVAEMPVYIKLSKAEV